VKDSLSQCVAVAPYENIMQLGLIDYTLPAVINICN